MNFDNKTIGMLRIGAVLNFLLAAGHLATLRHQDIHKKFLNKH